MAYALVGTIGVVQTATAGNPLVCVWGVGESRTAGNLLVCFLSVLGSATTPTTPAGWSVAFSQNYATGTDSATIFYKIATGADAAPTIAAITGGSLVAQLAEFSGNKTTSPLDQIGGVQSVSSPATASLGAADAASGELLLMAAADVRSTARASADTWTSNHGTITQAGNNNITSSTTHYSFGYCLATNSNSGANTAIMTASVTTSITGIAVVAASFLLPAAAVDVLPELIRQPMTPSRYRT